MKKTLFIFVSLLIHLVVFSQIGYGYQNSRGPGINIKPIDPDVFKINSGSSENSDLRMQQQRAAIVSKMNEYKTYYNSLGTYPEKIKDGWHKVILMNNFNYCDEKKVYVENNKVTKYVIEDWMINPVSFSSTITYGKSKAQLSNSDGTNGMLVDIYFFEDINNPNVWVEPPLKSGKVCFWSSVKRGGSMMIYVDENYIGSLESYFKEGTPNCEQDGTLTYKYKAGTYNFRATNNRNTWKGTITISPDNCTLQGLKE